MKLFNVWGRFRGLGPSKEESLDRTYRKRKHSIKSNFIKL